MDEQLHVRKVLEDFIEMPAVLFTLLLEFVWSYEWSDLKHIPLGVTCTCILDVTIHMNGTLARWCKKELRRCDKVYVTRQKGEYGSKFTFKFTIDGKSYELFHGSRMCVDTVVFVINEYSRVVFVSV